MKRIINRKVYDTETSEKLAEYDTPGIGSNDFRYMREALHRTKKGELFLAGEGGALTKYSKPAGNGRAWGESITLFSKEEALDWLEEHHFTEEMEKHFTDEVEEG